MPNTMHPALSDLLPFDKIPNELEANRDALIDVFDDIYVKNLLAGKSPDGSARFYTMDLTTFSPVGFNLPIA